MFFNQKSKIDHISNVKILNLTQFKLQVTFDEYFLDLTKVLKKQSEIKPQINLGWKMKKENMKNYFVKKKREMTKKM